MADDDDGQWRNRQKHRLLLKHEGKLLSKDDFFYMTANSGNTPSPRQEKLHLETKQEKFIKNSSIRNKTPPPIVEYCEPD